MLVGEEALYGSADVGLDGAFLVFLYAHVCLGVVGPGHPYTALALTVDDNLRQGIERGEHLYGVGKLRGGEGERQETRAAEHYGLSAGVGEQTVEHERTVPDGAGLRVLAILYHHIPYGHLRLHVDDHEATLRVCRRAYRYKYK